MKKFLLTLMVSGLCLNSALADQCTVIDEAQGLTFMDSLELGDYIGTLCEPCGDTVTELGGPTFEVVNSVNMVPFTASGEEGLYVIEINGKKVDLAYTYFRLQESAHYSVAINAALVVGCPTTGVTDFFEIGE